MPKADQIFNIERLRPLKIAVKSSIQIIHGQKH